MKMLKGNLKRKYFAVIEFNLLFCTYLKAIMNF